MNSEPKGLSHILWNNQKFDEFSEMKKYHSPKVYFYHFHTDPVSADSKFVDFVLTKILSKYSIDNPTIEKIVIGANELVENSVKHVYKFKASDDGGQNDILLGIEIREEFVHVYVFNKYVPIDEGRILGKLEQKVSKEKIEDNDALKSGKTGRGFLMTKMISDMIYAHQTSYNSGFGFIKLR